MYKILRTTLVVVFGYVLGDLLHYYITRYENFDCSLIKRKAISVFLSGLASSASMSFTQIMHNLSVIG